MDLYHYRYGLTVVLHTTVSLALLSNVVIVTCAGIFQVPIL